MTEFNILFTSAGRRVPLIRSFQDALADLGIAGKIVTADLKNNAPTAFIGQAHERVPCVTDPAYIPVLEAIAQKHSIKLVVPTIDTELGILSAHRERFFRNGTRLLVSSPEANEICFDKRVTSGFFRRAGVFTPELLDPAKILADDAAPYPFLLKPAKGSSSIGVIKIRNREELRFFVGYIEEPILQELLLGDEYTMDILVDFNSKVRSVVPRLRLETRAGEVSKGITTKNRSLIAAGKKVAEALPGAEGCITAQCFLSPEGKITFIEINPRFGGGFPLSAQAGAHFPRWIIELCLGRDPKIEIDGWQDGLAMLRYDEAVFVSKGKLV
jgi:carbamoyl-phosphate synthase large subunit